MVVGYRGGWLRRVVAVGSLSVFVLSIAACTIEAEPQPVVDVPAEAPPPPSGPPAFPITGQSASNAAIVTGETLTSDPGEGAGLFVAYLGDGVWRLTTTLRRVYAYAQVKPETVVSQVVVKRQTPSPR